MLYARTFAVPARSPSVPRWNSQLAASHVAMVYNPC